MKLLENKTLLIAGLGLIGGSIARGLVAAGAGMRILAHGRDEQALQAALIDGSIHAFSTDISTLAPQADIVILCTPTMTVRPMLEQLAHLVTPDAIITDAASVKGNVVADARRFFAGSLHRVVPGHPVAGSEQSGYRASRPDLFSKRKVILTPLLENSSTAVTTVMQLWQVLGADVHAMSAIRHDQVLAGTSHLPHLLAFTLVNTLVDSVGEPDRAQQVFDYAAGGFADFSRIASSDPLMWRDIFLANRDATVDVLDVYIKSLEQMKQRLLRGDGQGLESEFRRAKRVRDEFIRRFRPGSAQAESRQLVDSGFTVEPASISVRKGAVLQGFFTPCATLDEMVAAINDALLSTGVTVLNGVPDGIPALEYVQQLRERGIPVIGPENATLWIYGESGSESDAGSSQLRDVDLPTDGFLAGLMAISASLRSGSSLCIRCAKIGVELEVLLAALDCFGLSVRRSVNASGVTELVCGHQRLRAVDLETDISILRDEQLAVLVLAAALASGRTTLRLAADRCHRLIEFLGELGAWLADFDCHDGLLYVLPRERQGAEISARANVMLSLVAIVAGQTADGELLLHQPGDIAAHYPGLLGQWSALGMHFALNQA